MAANLETQVRFPVESFISVFFLSRFLFSIVSRHSRSIQLLTIGQNDRESLSKGIGIVDEFGSGKRLINRKHIQGKGFQFETAENERYPDLK